MKAFALFILLISVFSTFAVNTHHLKRTQVAAPSSNAAHDIGNVATLGDRLNRAGASQEFNQHFWDTYFQDFDVDGVEGLSKDEFHAGLVALAQSLGTTVPQPRPCSDSIYDDYNIDGDDNLNVAEAAQASQAALQFYADIVPNILRVLSKQLYEEQLRSRCHDVSTLVTRFQNFPSAAAYMAKAWDSNNDNKLSLDEVQLGNANFVSLMSLEPLSQDQVDRLFRQVDENHDGELDQQETANYVAKYLLAINKAACE